MERNIEHCLDLEAVDEGGYVNRSSDKGGPTNRGVTLKTYRSTVKPNATIADLKALSKEQARMIFRRSYADPVHFGEMPDGLDYCLLDESILSGPTRAIERLQKLLHVTVDGRVGAITMAAVKAADNKKLINSYCQDRLAWLVSLSGPQGFAGNPGWKPRVERVQVEALKLASQPTGPVIKTVLVEKPVAVPVTPPGATKMTSTRWSLGAIGVGGLMTQAHDFIFGLDPKVQIIAVVLIAVGITVIYVERRNLKNVTKELMNG